MKEIVVTNEYINVRIDKIVLKVLKNVTKGFIYKMYRKKNIVLNNKKITGKELLSEGDVITFYFSDETFDKFSKTELIDVKKNQNSNSYNDEIKPLKKDLIIYEDIDLIVYNKESNMLSQSNGRDHHLMECYEAYIKKYNLATDLLSSYGVCNRLDRNTTGTILIGRNPKSLRLINACIKEGRVQKLYHAIIVGNLNEDLELKGYLNKKSTRNKVVVTTDAKGDFIHTLVYPIKSDNNNKYTLVEVEIKTGKSHQIRAHLASVGYPLIGDGKYGDKKVNDFFRKQYGIRYHMLHSYSYKIGSIIELKDISNKTFTAPYFDEFKQLVKELF